MKIKTDKKLAISSNIMWTTEDGLVILCMENKGIINRVLQLLIKKPKISYIHLDEKGSTVWKMIDGKKTVLDIENILLKKHLLPKQYLHASLISYLHTLKENGFIEYN